MRYAILIMLGLVTTSFSSAAEQTGQPMGPAIAGERLQEPGAPSALRLKIVKDGFQLTWRLSPQDPGGVTGYEIVRADVFSGPYETVGKVDKGTEAFVDRTAKPEVIYFYKVRALAGNRNSPFSGEATGERNSAVR